MENNTTNNKIFLNGIISKEVPPTAPEFILGKFSMNVPDLKEWLDKNATALMDNGWINFTILRSKNTGKRYIEVDTYKKPIAPLETLPTVQVGIDDGSATDIPF